MQKDYVLDASVAIKWFFVNEDHREEALHLREQLIEAPRRFLVPVLFQSELLHVLSRKTQGDLRFVRQALDIVLSLGIRTLLLDDKSLKNAAKLVCEGISGYDATYVALAEQYDAIWVTADEKAAKKVGAKRALPLKAFK